MNFVASYRENCEDPDPKPTGGFPSSGMARAACDLHELLRAHADWIAPHLGWTDGHMGVVADSCDGSLYLVDSGP